MWEDLLSGLGTGLSSGGRGLLDALNLNRERNYRADRDAVSDAQQQWENEHREKTFAAALNESTRNWLTGLSQSGRPVMPEGDYGALPEGDMKAALSGPGSFLADGYQVGDYKAGLDPSVLRARTQGRDAGDVAAGLSKQDYDQRLNLQNNQGAIEQGLQREAMQPGGTGMPGHAGQADMIATMYAQQGRQQISQLVHEYGMDHITATNFVLMQMESLGVPFGVVQMLREAWMSELGALQADMNYPPPMPWNSTPNAGGGAGNPQPSGSPQSPAELSEDLYKRMPNPTNRTPPY